MTSWVEGVFSVAFWFYPQISGYKLVDRNVYPAFTCNSITLQISEGKGKLRPEAEQSMIDKNAKWKSNVSVV